MSSQELSSELRHLLDEGRHTSDALLHRLKSDPDPVEVVSFLEKLSQVDERRSRLLDQYRKQASLSRKREEEWSIRQFVLRALEQIGVPQATGFLEDYVYATELVEAKSRGMGALRRDEFRAWSRQRERPRVAYVVPALDETGSAASRWLARSDWPLADRIVVDGAEDLWALYRVRALQSAYRAAGTGTDALFVPLIDRYAREALGDELATETTEDSPASLKRMSGTVDARIEALEKRLKPARERAASRLSDKTEEQLLWGVTGR